MILETKLTLPQPKAGALLRTGLIDLIKNNLDKKLILITADAGYGKTTLLLQLVRAAKLPVVFYHLDQVDSDLLTFYSYLAAGLEQLSPGLAARSSGLLKQAEQIGNDHELLMGTLINELVEKRKEELFFVLDDYQHLAENSPVHQALDFFIDHMPESVHVIIASRAAVRFANYAKWYAKQNAFEVRRSDLRFSEDDVQELLTKSYSQTLGPDDLKSLLEHTEGWITGIQLVMADIRGARQKKTVKEALDGYLQAEHADPMGLFQYFTGEIISGEPGNIRKLLAASAIMETITPEACDAILETTGSNQLLHDLSRRNLFIFRVGKDEYKYHRLFQEFLLEQSSTEAKREFHRKAAEHSQQQGMNERAIGHWLTAGDSARAAGLIAQIADELKEQGRNGILSDWLGKIPSEVYEQQPRLLVIKASLLRDLGNLEEAEAMLLRAQNLIAKQASGKQDRSVVLADALLEYGGLLWGKGDLPGAMRLYKKALAACPSSEKELNAAILNGIGMIWTERCNFTQAKSCLLKAKAAAMGCMSVFLHIAIENNLAILMNAKGETKHAFDQYVSLVGQIGNDYYFHAGSIFGNAVLTALDYGQIVWAEKCLNRGQAVCKYTNDFRSRSALENACGCLYAAKGQWLPAAKCFQTALEQYREIGDKIMKIRMLFELGHLKRYTGDYGKAKEYYNQALADMGSDDHYSRAAILFSLSKAESSCHEFNSAGQKIIEAQGILRRIGDNSMEFNFVSAKAALYCSQGMKRKCVPLLGRMINLTKQKGYHGILARELKHNPDLAAIAFNCNKEKKYLEFLKSLTAKEENGIPGADALKACFFGNLRMILSDGREIPLKWRSLKSASLFAYLLLHRDRLCNREELMNALWPRVSKNKAGHDLCNTMYLLKKTLSMGLRQAGKSEAAGLSLIEHHDKGYGIKRGCFDCLDIEEFQKIWDDSRKSESSGNTGESLQGNRRCVELYKDDLLPNLGEWWCEEYRARYQKMYLFALHQLAMAAANSRDYTRSADYYRRYLCRDPYFGEARIGLWSALKALGKQAEIKKDYNDYCRLLKKEMREKIPEKAKQIYQNMMVSDST